MGPMLFISKIMWNEWLFLLNPVGKNFGLILPVGKNFGIILPVGKNFGLILPVGKNFGLILPVGKNLGNSKFPFLLNTIIAFAFNFRIFLENAACLELWKSTFLEGNKKQII